MSNSRLECPILIEHGIDIANGGLGEDQDWVKSLCVNCPFKRCIFDGGKRFDIRQRNKEIIKQKREGKTVKELALAFNLSESSIRGILRKS